MYLGFQAVVNYGKIPPAAANQIAENAGIPPAAYLQKINCRALHLYAYAFWVACDPYCSDCTCMLYAFGATAGFKVCTNDKFQNILRHHPD